MHVSALKSTQRFPVEAAVAGVDVWNAAAVIHPDLGWVAFATHSNCFWLECGPFEAKMRPWVSFLGWKELPEVTSFSLGGHRWDFSPGSLVAPFKACGMGPDTKYLVADFRPFIWNDTIWMSHTIELTDHPQRMALSSLDLSDQTLQLRVLFEKPMIGSLQGLSKQEKNWGFFLAKDKLMIMYSTLPCVHIFEYDASAPRHARERAKKCYKDPELLVKARSEWLNEC
ncbi:hypothetical protein WJX73_001827 [Symbiochloris irregularis]|uniref:Uncharacterized protein n=1 Tax=Symbiochloris irregularis TaxID=706552 RepID=A0AAW1NVX7_9CHLO